MLTIIENVVDRDRLNSIRSALQDGDWQSGQASAGSVSSLVKNNRQLNESDALALKLGDQILALIQTHPVFISAALPAKIYPPKFNRYGPGETYGIHVDSAIMRSSRRQDMVRTDLSATLFFTDPDEYEGGELVIETKFGAQAVKLPAGDLVLYPASSLHQVTPVVSGTRTSSFFWIQSMVRDDTERAHLFDLDQTIQSLRKDISDEDPRLVSLTGLYHNLLRRWSIV